MKKVAQLGYRGILKQLVGKQVHFTSDCELFPNFNVTGKVTGAIMKGTEVLMQFKTVQGKTITIGSNMKNLRYELK